LLEHIDPTVSVRSPSEPPAHLPAKFRQYITRHPTGKQLGLIMSLPTNGPALYIDSDVLFFSSAADLLARAAEQRVSACYLADCQFSGDVRLLRNAKEQEEPVNTGVLLLFEKLDWSDAIQRFSELEGEPSFFTNQTITHLAMHRNGASPFDRAKYVLQLDDQFVYRDRYAGRALALRHYVNPVRHKFWTNLNK
jgi:lipopolysaccharide biosynthesis glycosyltransferase